MPNCPSGLVVLSLIASACSTLPPPVEMLDVSTADLAVLSGEWYGSLSRHDSGRTESIVLLVHPGDSVRGEVLVTIEAERRDASFDGDGYGRAYERFIVALPIRALRVRGKSIRVEAGPSLSPECGCPLRMVLSGWISGDDALEGDFTTTATSQRAVLSVRTGRWAATKDSGASSGGRASVAHRSPSAEEPLENRH